MPLENPKKHIALVTTWFPPLKSVAVNRMLAFTKYLDKTKYKVTVITLNGGTALPKEEIHGATIFRLSNNQKIRLPKFNNDPRMVHYLKVIWKLVLLKFYKNEFSQWTKDVEKKMTHIHQQEPIDCVISSFSPVAPHLASYDFCEKHKAVKWIVDMRDEMSRNPQIDVATKRYFESVEKKIAKRATALISVSIPIVNYFKEATPNIKKYLEIRNGYDNEIIPKRQFVNDCFTILYAGNFYGKRKPHTFFEALVSVVNDGEMPEKWMINFVGTPKNFNVPKAIENNITFTTQRTQEECVDLMNNADVNLLIQPFVGRKGVFTGKVFDYLSVQKPILAVVDEQDVAAQLINTLKLGYVADFENINQIERQIRLAVDDWKNKRPIQSNIADIKKMHRKFQVKKLEQLIDSI